MKKQKININHIPVIIWGEESNQVYLYVHGKMSSKEAAETFAIIAEKKGYQTVSFDLPQHGERTDENTPCDIWHGMHDLTLIGNYVFENWKDISLYACSLGAYFSLQTYSTYPIKKCLFQSPILNMEYLIHQMMTWFNISEKRLAKEKKIETPIDVMTWDDYQFIKSHPVIEWDIPTNILYGKKDNLQSLEVIQEFTNQFNCILTIAPNSEHPFMDREDQKVVEKWLQNNI